MNKIRNTIFIPTENKISASEYLTMLVMALDAVNTEENDEKYYMPYLLLPASIGKAKSKMKRLNKRGHTDQIKKKTYNFKEIHLMCV